MGLEQGILRPGGNVRGRQVTQSRPQQKTEGIGISRIQRLLNTGTPNICIIRSLGGIGDVLMTTPLLRAIKNKWPKSHLTYATDFGYMDGALKDLLLYNPYIDELLQYHVANSKEYDFKVDVTSVCLGYEKPGTANVPNRIDLFANHVGVSLEKSGYLPTYIVSEEEKIWAKEKLQRYPRNLSNSPRIGVQVRSSSQSRSWPLENVRELVARLSNQYGAQVIVFDSSFGHGDTEQWNMPGVVLIKDYKIRQVAALINEVDLMVTPDSGLMHIAGALNKRIVSIWAGTDSKSRINHYPNAIAIAKTNFACHPCWYQPVACNKAYTCIKSITVDEVLDATLELLNETIIIPSVFNHDNQNTNTINLCRRLGGYGDIACLTPVVRDLKIRYPDKNINIIAPKKYHCIFDGNPDVELCVDISKQQQLDFLPTFDLTDVDAQYETQRVSLNKAVDKTRSEIYIEATGGKSNMDSEVYVPSLYVSDEELEWVRKRFMKEDGYTYVLTVLNTSETYRNWPLSYYDKMFKIAEEDYPDIRFVISSDCRNETNFPENVIDATGFSFRRTIALTALADCVITPDTSVLHVAAAFEKKCIALFGPIDCNARCKHYKNTVCLYSELECGPCWRNDKIPCQYNQKVVGDHSYCMSQIKPDVVLGNLEVLCQT